MNAIRLSLLLGCCLALGACEDKETVTTIEQQVPGTAPVDPAVFVFRTDMPDAYVKVDRMGGPATTTALLSPGSSGGSRRQDFNESEPNEDAQYALEYRTALQVYHFELQFDLQQRTLAACGVPGATPAQTDVTTCLGQAAPLVVPDVLTLDTRQPSNYPNGRRLDDPVVDRLLALGLLDLTDAAARCNGVPCTINSFHDLPLNVRISDPPSLPDFPYLNNRDLAPPPPADP